MFTARSANVATADVLGLGFLDVQGGSSLTVTSLDAQGSISPETSSSLRIIGKRLPWQFSG